MRFVHADLVKNIKNVAGSMIKFKRKNGTFIRIMLDRHFNIVDSGVYDFLEKGLDVEESKQRWADYRSFIKKATEKLDDIYDNALIKAQLVVQQELLAFLEKYPEVELSEI